MVKTWGLMSRFLLFSVAFALGMASNFLLRSHPAATTTTATMLQLVTTIPSLPPPPPSPPPPSPLRREEVQPSRKEEQHGNDDGGGDEKSIVMMHNMTDDELLLRASMAPRIKGIDPRVLGAPKVAFMFLVRGELPLAPLWERFFDGHAGLYSVYVHPDPSYAGSPDKGSMFYGRRVPSKEARWGQSSIAEAERRLLANALLDAANHRFVLLSETCIPLFNFSTVYSYLMRSGGGAATSFVDFFDAPGFHVRGRYRPAMAPTVTRAHWRKGSQWFAADRALSLEVVADETYFPVFQRHCVPPCVMDEHYLPTFIAASGWPRNANRTLTYARWLQRSPHPESFKDVSAELLQGIRNCSVDGGRSTDTEVCYLFARKLLPEALPELLRLPPRVAESWDTGESS